VVDDLGDRIPNPAPDREKTATTSDFTSLPESSTDALDRSNRAVDKTDHFTDVDLSRRPGEVVPALRALLTLDESAALELHEQIRKKLLGDRLPAGDLLDPYRPFVAALGKFEKRPEPVLAAM
jgi:hypothetical protein